ncbi:MAG: rod shape-determining protein MreC [Gammaproteobacteria bacterium]|nr:rod shape-determining protein MreC [Gammaproteobacteria bacterium]NNJ49470.1 rod shape-determining protein MreC [Gammaproteobacteria bacterium]
MVVLVIASIVLMTVDHRWHSLELVRSALSGVLYPLQYTIDLPIRLFYWADETLSTQQALLEKNREFEARHLENRVQLQKLDIIEKENERLRELLGAIPKTTERLLISEIINVDLDPYKQLILLNKGSSSDVYQGQPIIDAQGVMGQVVHVGPMSSTAVLITDASHAIPVQVNRTGLRAIAFGSGKIDQLNLRHLPHNVDIKQGDLLITSGLGGVFPPNFPVAVISKIERPAGEPFATIEAKPHALLDKSREVLLVWRNEPVPVADKAEEESVTVEQAAEAKEEKKSTQRRGNRE